MISDIKIVYIYKLINPIDNQIFYVGYTNNPKKRLIEHLRTKGRREKNIYKDNIINKIIQFGLKPEMEIIDECSYLFNSNLNKYEHEILEMYYIKKYRNDGVKLANLTDGGDGGCTSTKEVYQYDENGLFLKKYNSFREFADYYRINSSLITGVIDQKSKKSYKSTYLFTSHENAKIFEFKKTMKLNIPIMQLSLEHELIAEFYNQKEASKLTNIPQPNINHCLKKRRKQAGGFYWEYKK